MSFTAAESDILAWFARNSRDPNLRAQIAAACPGNRDVTSVGFFTELLLPPRFELVEHAVDEQQIALEGCGLFAPELNPFASCLLHTRGGKIVSLEVYSVAQGHPSSVSSFEVRDVHGSHYHLWQ